MYQAICMNLFEIVLLISLILASYKSFVCGMNEISKPLLLSINSLLSLLNNTNGDMCFINGTKIEVGKIYRKKRHKTMKRLATKSKSTT